jgi:hypothetical protein
LGDAEDCRKPSDYLLRGCESFPSVPKYLLVREETFLDDSNCFRNDLDSSQSQTESNFRLAGEIRDVPREMSDVRSPFILPGSDDVEERLSLLSSKFRKLIRSAH